jgi:putative ABC transport system permease protein
MRYIARASIRQRKASFAGVFVAVVCAAALLTALGVLFESGLRAGVPPQRYAATAVVVGGAQEMPVHEDIDVPFAERVPLPASTVDKVAAVSGVDKAIGDIGVTVNVVTGDGLLAGAAGHPVRGYGWGSAALTPFAVREGREPSGPGEVVLDADLARRAGTKVGGTVELAVGSEPSQYRVSGIATPPSGDGLGRQSALFFTDEHARELSGRTDQVDTIGVLARPGVDADDLAARIAAAVPGVTTHTGNDRGDVEFLDVGAARSQLIVFAAAFGGTTMMLVMLVVASTLTLSIQQRRREFALLRAVAASRRQIHRLVGSEVLLVAGLGAIIGAVPGYGLAYVMRAAFAKGGLVPEDFGLAIGPIPAAAAIVLCLLTARVAGLIAARRPARISPVEALGESSVDPPSLPRVRIMIGYFMVLAGIATSGLPMLIPGEAGAAGAGVSALLLVVSIALLGPKLVSGAARVLGTVVRRVSPVGGFLATANMTVNSRRLAAGVTPLVLAVTLASVQIFAQSTIAAAADAQAKDGVVADFVVSSSASGLGQQVAESVRNLDGVEYISPLVRSVVLVPFIEAGNPQVNSYAAQGVEPERLDRVLDLEPREGRMADLHGETVALSQLAAETLGIEVGQTMEMRLGDGAELKPRIVAIYGRGLGFGDVTLPHDLLLAHTSVRLDQSILVRATDPAAVGPALRDLAGKFPGMVVLDRAGLAAAGQQQREAQDWPNLIALAVLLGYIAIAVVNTLVMSTADRGREFALLRLIGSGRRQVRRMMRLESLVVFLIAAVIGTVASIPPLVGFSIGMTESPVPSISVPAFIGILGTTALLGFLAIGIPTRLALRSRPVDAIGMRE